MRRLALLVLALTSISMAWATTPEDRLSSVFEAIEANQIDVALKRVDALIADYPNFRLAHLVRGDLLLARARPLETFGNVVKTVPRERLDGLRDEALARLRAQRLRPTEDRLPRYVLQLNPEQKHALVVDSRRSRLYVYANDGGKPRLIADYYVTLGKNGIDKTREGDQKTPVGVYHVTANLPRKKLTDFYGAGAFPINANPDLESVGQRLQIGLTPVIIADEIEWSDAGSLETERSGLAAALEQWRADWQSRDTERYLAHYSQRFSSLGQDYAAWGAHKRKVNAAKSWIKVGLGRVTMLRYPHERDMVVVTFDQDYRSDGLSNVMKKRQYWAKEAGRWKILYEGPG